MGFAATDTWMEKMKFGSVLTYNVTWLCVYAVFFFIPGFLFVLGRNTEPLSRAWILNPSERAEYWIVVKRMIVWFVCAGVSGLAVSALLSYA